MWREAGRLVCPLKRDVIIREIWWHNERAIGIIDDIITDINDNYFYARLKYGVWLSSNGIQLTYPMEWFIFLKRSILSHF